MASPGARDEQPTQQGQEATPPLRPATVSCCSRCCTVEVWSSALSSIWAVVLISSQIFLFGISSVVFLFAAIVVSGLFATLVAIIYGWVLLRVRAQVHARGESGLYPARPSNHSISRRRPQHTDGRNGSDLSAKRSCRPVLLTPATSEQQSAHEYSSTRPNISESHRETPEH